MKPEPTIIDIKKLKPYPKNAKKHSEKQIGLIAKSIEKYGFLNPVLIDDNHMILAGHGRIDAAKKLGITDIPCVKISHLTDSQKREYILADNRLAELAEWDMDILQDELKALDIDLFDLGFYDSFLPKDKAFLTDEDDAPPLEKTPITKLGDVWILGNHRLMCGDSTDKETVSKLMNGEKADMVFTDPPYGVSYADKNKMLNAISRGNCIQREIKNDHMNLDQTSDFVFKAFCRIKEILAKRSSYYITAPQVGDLMMMMMMMMTKSGLPLRHTLIWVKNNHVLGQTDYNYKHEPILYGWVDVHDFYKNGAHKFSTWEIPKPMKNDLHPTMKPIELVENAILNSTKNNQIVADIFGGSGSTLIACEKTDRQCRMMELDPLYCDVIVRRWQDFTGNVAFLEASGQSFQEVESNTLATQTEI